MRIIAGEARGRRIEAPTGRNTRPTLDRIRENIFNMIQSETASRKILDLFAGSGALSLEALSRGASFAVLVDCDRKANAVQRKNAETLGLTDRCRLMLCDWQKALQILRAANETFDLVFLDPPYAKTDLKPVFYALREVILPDSLIVLEHENGKTIEIGNEYECVKERAWGYCAVSFFRPTRVQITGAKEKPEETV